MKNDFLTNHNSLKSQITPNNPWYQEQENNPKIFSEEAQLIFPCFSRMKYLRKCKNSMGSNKPSEEREKPRENKV